MSEFQHIVCPYCDTTNRISSARLGQAPRCGRCHQALFTRHPIDLTAKSFQQHLQHSDIALLVDFWAPWCGPCKSMAPAFSEAAATLEPSVRLVKVNTDNEQELANQFGIRSIPTLVLFKGGREIDRQSGAIGAADIVRWAEQRR